MSNGHIGAAPLAAPLPRHLVNAICPTGRFISYVEDEPMVWSQSFGDRQAAIDAMRWFVSQRLIMNGAGCGAVLDNDEGTIVAVDEIPMPSLGEMSEMAEFIRERCRL